MEVIGTLPPRKLPPEFSGHLHRNVPVSSRATAKIVLKMRPRVV